MSHSFSPGARNQPGGGNSKAKKLSTVFDGFTERGAKNLENIAYQGTLKSYPLRVRVKKWATLKLKPSFDLLQSLVGLR